MMLRGRGRVGFAATAVLALSGLTFLANAVGGLAYGQEGGAPAPSPQPMPAKGDVLAPFDAEGVDGSNQHIDYPKGTTTMLLFFLSGCPTCHKMLPEWGRVYAERRDSLRILGVLMDREPPGFFTQMQIPFPVLRSPSRDFLKSYKISRAPVTLRIAAGGKVEDAAVGLVDPIRLGDLFRPPQ
jgi:hypothetical protein